LPPEITSALVLGGAGSEPLRAAAAAWAGLAEELDSAGESFRAITTDLIGAAWQGPSSAAMAATAAPYSAWLSASASGAQQAATQAGALAAQFESVRAAVVQPLAVAANRSDLLSLVMSNVFGQNAPVIASVEAAYEAMWAQDVSAMAAYHAGASAVAAALTPFAQSLQAMAGAPGALVQATPLSLGAGNVGGANLGTSNLGLGNVGSGNTGLANLGV